MNCSHVLQLRASSASPLPHKGTWDCQKSPGGTKYSATPRSHFTPFKASIVKNQFSNDLFAKDAIVADMVISGAEIVLEEVPQQGPTDVDKAKLDEPNLSIEPPSNSVANQSIKVLTLSPPAVASPES